MEAEDGGLAMSPVLQGLPAGAPGAGQGHGPAAEAQAALAAKEAELAEACQVWGRGGASRLGSGLWWLGRAAFERA